MPASTLDPVNAALRTSLSKSSIENSIDSQLAGSTKKALLSNIEFETAGNYQTNVLDKLKSKYIVLKQTETPQASKPENMGADETLAAAKHELYPLDAVQLGWNNSDWSVGAGMVNMGNTCYLNSTLQALFHVPALVNWLVSDKQHMAECEDSGGLCIICAMRKTLHDSQQRNSNSIRPFLIYNKLRVVCRNLIPGRQEDAHEFLRYLVEAMEKAYLNRFKNHSEFDSRTKETTPLNQILGGYLRSAVRCLECGHVSTTFQHFQDLLLDIRKAQTLDEALEGYFSREKLDDESYHCESCQKKVPATKQFSLERAPMVLCIQLKRFSVSNNKITKHIQFRQRLELTRYARQRPNVPLVYRLVALVTHMGPTVNCGHYTAVAQAPCGNFYQFDDSMVRPISHQAVFSTNAYIMLYELECTPFAKSNGSSSNPKPKASIAVSSSDKEEAKEKNKTQINGNTSSKFYGPELPPQFAKSQQQQQQQKQNQHQQQNGSSSSSSSSSTVNGSSAAKKPKYNSNASNLNANLNTNVNNTSSSSSDSDSETESKKVDKAEVTVKTLEKHGNGNKQESKIVFNIATVPKAGDSKAKASIPKIPLKALNGNSNSSTKALDMPVVTSSSSSAATASSSSTPVTKLVPYDDESSSSEDSSITNSPNEINSRVSTKAAVGEWKVTSTTAESTANGHDSSPENNRSWNGNKKNGNNSNKGNTNSNQDRSTVNELLRMSHSGYSAPVSSWNGTRSQLEKEINNEKREDRKRALSDNSDQGRTKHVKLNSGNSSFKSNPGYNPIQEYHNAKNWSQSSSNGSSQPYRPFFNGGNRHRNQRRNFHHKNYHKSYRFRQ